MLFATWWNAGPEKTTIFLVVVSGEHVLMAASHYRRQWPWRPNGFVFRAVEKFLNRRDRRCPDASNLGSSEVASLA